MRLSIGYSDSEDRVWLRIEGSNAIWWLTRRIALGLVRQWATLVERSYNDEGMSVPQPEGERPAPSTRARSAHTAAVATAKPVPPVGRPAPGVEMLNRTVSSIEISVVEKQFRIVFKGSGSQDAIRLTRDEAHRMLAALYARCRRSGWFNAEVPAWLAGDMANAGNAGNAGGARAPGTQDQADEGGGERPPSPTD